jgi:ribosomal protein L37AE/L43A
MIAESVNIHVCPRCHSDHVKSGRISGRGSKHYIRCENCGHEIKGDTLATLATIWNVSKEDHVAYVPKILSNYGNCFIAQKTCDIWEGYDLADYLSKLTDQVVILRECNYMDNGRVAEMKRY